MSLKFILNLYIDVRERGEWRQKFVVPLIYALVDSCMCPDQGSNPQTWCIGTIL